MGKCEFPTCSKGGPHRKGNVKVHQTKRYHCMHEGCGRLFSQPGKLKRHMRTHTGDKPYHCAHKGCGRSFSRPDTLKAHMRTHSGDKPCHCTFPGCELSFSQPGNLKTHMRTHTGEKPYHCTFPGCGLSFSRPDTLKAHMRTHTGEKPYHCTFPGCGLSFSRPDTLKAHMRTHTGEKPYHCTFPWCGLSFSGSGHLKTHMRTHSGEKPYHCKHDGCEYSCSQPGTLNRHQKTHTTEGQIRRKKQENRLHKQLKGWGYTVDCETTINAKAGQCLTDTQRHFSRLDFRVVECVNCICIVECDEEQHYWYNLSCEMSRMSDVRAALVLAGYTLPIYWIRYAPTGKYCVGGEQVKVPRKRREEALKEHLARVCSPDFMPAHQESVHYMYYDLFSHEEGPEILCDPDFPDALNEVVSWHNSTLRERMRPVSY